MCVSVFAVLLVVLLLNFTYLLWVLVVALFPSLGVCIFIGCFGCWFFCWSNFVFWGFFLHLEINLLSVAG